MTGCIIENMSSRKLTYVVCGLLALQVGCFLLGAIVSPNPNASMQFLAAKCVDLDGGTTDAWFYQRGEGACDKIQSLVNPHHAKQLGPENIVFSFQMPHMAHNQQLWFDRWQQNLIGVLSTDIEYEEGVEHDPRVSMLFQVRLGYRNRGDPDDAWKEYASSVVHRNLDCEIDEDKKRDGYYYNCSIIPLFELGSLHHEFYLLNLRIPSAFDYEGHSVNVDSKIGRLVDLWMVAIHQNGGFTKVWVTMKTVFLPLVLGELYWFWNRLRHLPRPTTLLEKMLLSLGCALSLLNLPLEYATLSYDMPWLPLFNDVKQGIFYAALMVFWLVFAGEHLINNDSETGAGEKNGLMAYWKKLAVVLFGCLCLFIFDVCERGVQLQNPFYSIWVTDLGTQLALAFIILAGVSAGVFFLFLCFMIYRVFLTIAHKQASLSQMSRVRRLHYQGIIWRFRFLMMATLVTAAMTTVGFILGQVSEGQYKWDEDISLEYTSGFMTGVYGMWNIYVLGLLFLYAPSHKQWNTSHTSESVNTLNDANAVGGNADGGGVVRTGEEIEFSVSSVTGANEPSEMSSLTDFIRHQAQD